MRTIERQCAQGDVLFTRVAEVPASAVAQPKSARVVVAHSETGHDHFIAAALGEVELLTTADPNVCYLRIAGAFADVVHARSFDTHETIRLPRGVWQVNRQEEWTPEGWRQVQD